MGRTDPLRRAARMRRLRLLREGKVMAKDDTLTIEPAKARFLSHLLTEDEDPEIWAEILAGQNHLSQWFRAIGAELVVHAEHRIALLRQMTEAQRERCAREYR